MRSAAAATALGITLALAGLASCAGPGDPVAPPEPRPSASPVFASEEEALAAAEELYGRYYALTNTVGASGWRNLADLETVLGEEALEQELATARSLAAKGYRQVGSASFDTVTLQQLIDNGHLSVDIVIYACGDVRGVDVIDEQGISVVESGRPDRQPVEVEMNDKDGDLKIVRREAWSGASFC